MILKFVKWIVRKWLKGFHDVDRDKREVELKEQIAALKAKNERLENIVNHSNFYQQIKVLTADNSRQAGEIGRLTAELARVRLQTGLTYIQETRLQEEVKG